MRRAIAVVLTLALTLISTACANSGHSPASAQFDGGYPSDSAADAARDEADFQRAVTAYRFWYPTVSCEGIFNGARATGMKANESMLIMAAGPRQVAFTPNSDTPYGAGAIDLTKGPFVIEVPPGPFIGLVDDRHQGWVLDLGIPGPAGAKGGKHLILPPGYDGQVPDGYHVGRSASNVVLLALRSMPQNGDTKGALEALRQVKIYPLASAANPKLMSFVDVSDRPSDSTCLAWEDNLQYWQKLAEILQSEPLVERFFPMYGQLAALGIEKGKPFQPDARMKAILERSAKAGRDQMLVAAFASDRPDRIAWPDRKWEWAALVPGSVQFETKNGGIDLEARDRWFAQAIVTSPAMFRRDPQTGSLYWLGVRDASGAFLDGGKTYKLTVPLPVPNKLFWSVTIYDARTRSQVSTDQDKAALRSLFELKDVSGSSVDLYFGPRAPAGKEGRWIKTTTGDGWFAYFRIYGPEQPAFDGSWKPGDFEEVK